MHDGKKGSFQLPRIHILPMNLLESQPSLAQSPSRTELRTLFLSPDSLDYTHTQQQQKKNTIRFPLLLYSCYIHFTCCSGSSSSWAWTQFFSVESANIVPPSTNQWNRINKYTVTYLPTYFTYDARTSVHISPHLKWGWNVCTLRTGR